MICLDVTMPPLPERRPLVLVVAAALLDSDGRVLLSKRPPGKIHEGLWEFPGGKLEAGEVPENGLCRELAEELGLHTHPSCLTPFAFASHGFATGHLLLMLFLCRQWQGTPRPLEGQELAWFKPPALTDLPMPPADLPLVRALQEQL